MELSKTKQTRLLKQADADIEVLTQRLVHCNLAKHGEYALVQTSLQEAKARRERIANATIKARTVHGNGITLS